VGGFIPVWEKSNEGQRIKIFEYVHILLSRRRSENGVPDFSNKFEYLVALTKNKLHGLSPRAYY
jgi:hypothetical protein